MKPSRKTRQKNIIKDALDKIDHFFTAEDLFEKVRKENIGIATVYRFLNNLERANNVYSYVCNRKKVYSKEMKSHCHFICEKTGKVTHFNIDSLDFLKNKIPGMIKSFQIEVRGKCEECKK
jgi:Fe2+ or Zn2+ uptake regulation protein